MKPKITVALIVLFFAGAILAGCKTGQRPAKGAGGAGGSDAPATGTQIPYNGSVFVINGDGTVTDIKRKLIWQTCSSGLEFKENKCVGSAEVFTWTPGRRYCGVLKLRGKSWRLPTVDELKTLVDLNQKKRGTDPAIHQILFPGTAATLYWTANRAPVGYDKYAINFNDGRARVAAVEKPNHVRCVTKGP